MPPRELSKHQLSSRLEFQSHTPAFLRVLQNKIAGFREEDDEDEPQYENREEAVDEFGRSIRRDEPDLDEFGREIRKDSKENGEDPEEDGDEKPLVVVLKEGKHLTELEAENERRKARGLSPVREVDPVKKAVGSSSSTVKVVDPVKVKSGAQFGKASGKKRKAPVMVEGEESGPPMKKHKTKVAKKNLLSFGDDG